MFCPICQRKIHYLFKKESFKIFYLKSISSIYLNEQFYMVNAKILIHIAHKGESHSRKIPNVID